MKTFKYIVVATLMLGASLPSMGQVVRRSERDKDKKESNAAGVTDRMKEFYEPSEVSDANKMWERIVYRQSRARGRYVENTLQNVVLNAFP